MAVKRGPMTKREVSLRCGRGGFTLIEVGIAVALFSIVLLSAGGMLTAISSGSTHSRVKTTGTFHMQRQVEQIYETTYAALASGQADTTLANGVVIRASWTVTELVPNALKQADLRVRTLSNFPGGYERAVRLFVSNRNP